MASVSFPLPTAPSIAVLPFVSISGDAEAETFADGITEDIITALSKIPDLMVIARHSTFVYKGRSVDIKRVGRELGVRYVLEGSLRKAGKRVRVTTQLIEAESGHHLTASRYDRSLDDLFAVQDKITLNVANEMNVNLLEDEQGRHFHDIKTLEAWELAVRARSHLRPTREECAKALHYVDRALALEPNTPALLGLKALLFFADGRHGWSGDRSSALSKAETLAQQALASDQNCVEANISLAGIDLSRGDHDACLARLEEVITRYPSDAEALAWYAFSLAVSDRPQEALNAARQAMRLSPFYPAWYRTAEAFALRLLGRFDEALAIYRALQARDPSVGLVDLVIVLGELGDEARATIAAQRLLEHQPRFSIGSWRATQLYRNEYWLRRDIACLERAGLPTQDVI